MFIGHLPVTDGKRGGLCLKKKNESGNAESSGVKSRERFAEVQHAQNAGTALRRRASHFAREKARKFSRRRQMFLGELNGTVEEMIFATRL